MLPAMKPSFIVIALGLISLTAFATGCRKNAVAQEPATGPDYGRQLQPGESALRLITDPARLPDIGLAYRNRDVFLLDAIDGSLSWFDKKSTKQFYPFESISHDQANASLIAFAQMLQSASDEAAFAQEIKRTFNVYESVG